MVLSAYCKGKACHLNWIKIEIVAATARTHAVCFIYLFTAIRGKGAFLNDYPIKGIPRFGANRSEQHIGPCSACILFSSNCSPYLNM
jgi:fructose-1,6-bisphosphatase/inositol monophosphatase family enzyme